MSSINTAFMTKRLTEVLHLDTGVLGIKLYKDKEALPISPGDIKVNICQLVSAARHQGRAVSGIPESMVCAIGAACTGLIKTPERFKNGQAPLGRYVANVEAGKKFIANTFKLGDEGKIYDGIYIAPLESYKNEKPDVVVMYANPAQTTRLIHCCLHETGEPVKADTVAEAALCSSIGFVLKEKKPIIGFPCVGDRTYGGTQKDELIFAAPFDMLEELVKNMESLLKGFGQLFPFAPYNAYTPTMTPAYTMRREDLE
ncbi:MAG: hypothetical protein PWP31_920 [Clostridia bacterium]|nr:hypothetical protein [Clostridia bacterium]